MGQESSPGNVPSDNQDGSRSPKYFKKFSRRRAPRDLFAHPIEGKEHDPEIADHGRIANEEASLQQALTWNRNLALVIATTHSVGFLTPIWVIFGTDHLQLSLLLSLVLGSTGWVTSSIFEVPLGAFADRFGRKLSLISGLFLCAIGDLSLVAFNNFALLMAFQFLAGLGFALRSGSLEALLHDTYESAGHNTQYAKLSSLMLFLVSVSRIATVPVGAWLYQLNTDGDLSSYTFPYIASVCAYVIALLAASMLTERRSSHRELEALAEFEQGHLAARLWRQTAESWGEMMSNKDVKRVLVTIGLYAFIGEGSWALYQSYFRERGITLTDSSWIYSVLVFLMALGSLYVARVYKKINVLWAMNFIIAIVAFDIVLMHLPVYVAMFAFMLTAFVSSMSWYLQDNAIQNRMSGDRKSTALSIASMTYNIGAMIGIYGIGALAQRYSVSDAQWFFVAYGAVVFIGLSLWNKNHTLAVLPEDAHATTEVTHGHVDSRGEEPDIPDPMEYIEP